MAENSPIKLPKLEIEHGEKLNTLSHFIAGIGAFIGVFLLLSKAVDKEDVSKIISCTIYGVSTIGIFILSVLYHTAKRDRKDFYRKLDCIGIYFKIAGNYTPYMILAVHGIAGWSVLFTVWFLALLGVFIEVVIRPQRRVFANCIYLIMASTVIPILNNLMSGLHPEGFALVMFGFLLYAIGFVVFLNDERIKHGHGIWHLFVAGGSSCQFLCLLLYVV